MLGQFADTPFTHPEGAAQDDLDNVDDLKERPVSENLSEEEGWSALQKGLLFFIVLGAVAFYIRWAQRRDQPGYKKTAA